MLQVSQLFIYPIKSLGGIALDTAEVTDRGFKYDRRWMLIDENNRFVSQREFAEMALLKVSITSEGLKVSYTTDGSSVQIPFEPQTQVIEKVTVWDDTCDGTLVSPEVDEWFSSKLNFKCKLVYMADSSLRKVETNYAKDGEITSFSDGYPFLIIGQSSLDDLNQRLSEQCRIDRFRANIIFTGGTPFQEDHMHHFTLGGVDFYGVKLCGRCVVITIDQQKATKNAETLKTLSSYRAKNNKVYFGQNLLHKGVGNVKIGDIIHLGE